MENLLRQLHQSHGAQMEERGGVGLPLAYGALGPETGLFFNGAALMDLESGGGLLVSGPQAASFLDGLATSPLAGLPVGQALHTLFCNGKGRVAFQLAAARTKPQEFLLLPPPGQTAALAAHLEFFHVREELAVGRAPLARLELLGPLAASALHQLSEGRLGGAAGANGAAGGVVRWHDGPLAAFQAPYGPLDRWAVLTTPPLAPTLAQALLALPGVGLAGWQAFLEARLWARWPLAGQDYPEGRFPAEAGLNRLVALGQGCYIGQEFHNRMAHRGHPNHKLAALSFLDGWAHQLALAPDSPLYAEGKPAGQLASLGQLPLPPQTAGQTDKAEEPLRWAIARLDWAPLRANTPFTLDAAGGYPVTLHPLSTDNGL